MTTERVDLPSGGWAELRDPNHVTHAERQAVWAARMRRPDDDTEVMLDGLTRAMMTVLIARWQVSGPDGTPLAPPREDPTSVDQMTGVDYDKLHDHLLLTSMWTRLFPRFRPNPAPDSPFGSSGASSNGAKDSPSTPTSPSPSTGSGTGSS